MFFSEIQNAYYRTIYINVQYSLDITVKVYNILPTVLNVTFKFFNTVFPPPPHSTQLKMRITRILERDLCVIINLVSGQIPLNVRGELFFSAGKV